MRPGKPFQASGTTLPRVVPTVLRVESKYRSPLFCLETIVRDPFCTPFPLLWVVCRRITPWEGLYPPGKLPLSGERARSFASQKCHYDRNFQIEGCNPFERGGEGTGYQPFSGELRTKAVDPCPEAIVVRGRKPPPPRLNPPLKQE